LREHLSEFLKKNDKNLEQQSFWERYEQRKALYKSRLSSGFVIGGNDNIVSAFSVSVMSRLHDWPSLVLHHSANSAMTVLNELCGDNY
jgi:hypothetical protein